MVLKKKPTPVRRLNRSVSPQASRLVSKCLAKDPKARVASAVDLAEALRACL
jgi:hypothetical protein